MNSPRQINNSTPTIVKAVLPPDDTGCSEMLKITQSLGMELQWRRAEIQHHRTELQKHQAEEARIIGALEALGQEPLTAKSQKSRPEAVRDYLVDHPNEIVATKMVKADPAKYGIITTSPKLHLNWLYGRQNPTARKFFDIRKGVIKLRPGVTKDTPACK